jgi:serine/threonine protein kinase
LPLKLLRERLIGEESAQTQLLREARTASRLNHAHICTVHEVGETADQTYIVMECLEGRLLVRWRGRQACPARR